MGSDLDRPSPELRPGPHFAPYGAICPTCDRRHGTPAHTLEVSQCPKCIARKVPPSRKTHGGEIVMLQRRAQM